jgi:prolyl 4-hydroxylase
MNEQWKNWVKENLARGCSHDALRTILRDHHFSSEDIEAALNPNEKRTAPSKKMFVDHAALATIRITRHATPIETDSIQLYKIDDFMSAAECDELIAQSREALVPSTITTQATEADKYFRTSSTCHLSQIASPLVAIIDTRIADTIGIPPAYSEGIQIQRYEVGQQLKAHTDYFEPNTQEYETYCRTLGNRTWTFMVYLNDTAKGGGTQFTMLGQTFYPKRGTALVWNNLRTDGRPNPSTRHQALPVEEGYKVVITKWFREYSYGAENQG